MSCYGCIFKSVYQDMGANCDVCQLKDYLPDAIKACDNSENCPHRVTLQEAKKKLLSSDVVEVRHGEWKYNEGGGYVCSKCNCWLEDYYGATPEMMKYCFNCGAKMDGERREE